VSRGRRLALAAGGALLFALTAAGLYAQPQDNITAFVAIALGQGAVYLLAAWLARGTNSARAVAFILAVAIGLRAVLLFTPPHLSDDIYRYVWDGRVIAAGVNPYRHIPTDPELAALQDAEIFPNINRNNYARTIYPPAAEAIFFGVTRLSESLSAMKAAMVLCEAVAVALLLAMLMSSGQPVGRIIVYAWHPLPLWEFAGSGHIDAAVVVFVALALWSRRRAGSWLTGIALALGMLVKFYPGVLLPALWRRRDGRMPAIFAAAVILAYLPFLGVGWGVFGFLPHYLVEEGFAGDGGGFYLWNLARWLLPLGGVPHLAYIAAAAVALGGLALGIALRQRDDADYIRDAALLAGAFIVLLSPHYPWYFAWLIVFACLVPAPSLLWLSVASFLLYLVPVGSQLVADRPRFIVESVLYLPFIALAASELWRWRARKGIWGQPRHGEQRA
jgi:alpha-1,6-mannosyltransferase